jgi:spectinomycin phosphotransferase
MLTEPPDLDAAALARLIVAAYGRIGPPPRFVPAGEDSWCYRTEHLWITVRRDLRGHHPQAYRGAHELRRQGMDFVLAPIAATDGAIVHRVSGYPVLVFPFVACETLEQRAPDRAEARRAVALLDTLHASGAELELPFETFALSFAADLEAMLGAAGRPPRPAGPFSRATHDALVECLDWLNSLVAERETLAVRCERLAGTPVLTHGEPLPSNILRQEGALLIADWGDLAWAPPERDWSHCRRTLGHSGPCRPDFTRLYDLGWILSEIVEYATILLKPHENDADSRAMWSRLGRYLPSARARALPQGAPA